MNDKYKDIIDKHKGMATEHGRSASREKMVPVAPGSQQGRAPGSGPGPGNMQASAAGLGGRPNGDAGARGRVRRTRPL